MIVKTVAEAEITADDILEAVIVGNPIMHHLFLGIDPIELGGAPFALTLSSALTQPAKDVIPSLPPSARLHTLPCIAGHVGADAAAVTLSERPYESEQTTLLVDIGTNAEIILGNKDRVLAASSPTGPAFEGAEISCGQRAAPGAIERVRIDPETYQAKFKIIGADVWSDEVGLPNRPTKPVSLEFAAPALSRRSRNYICRVCSQRTALITPPAGGAGDHLVAAGRTYSYMLHRGQIEISISQKDVRAIQLAKAALYAGARLLMDKLGVDEVARVKLAGAFGSYIDPKYAMVLGLIPDCDLKKVSGIGNAASTGARMALLNRRYREEIQQQVRKLDKVETAMEAQLPRAFRQRNCVSQQGRAVYPACASRWRYRRRWRTQGQHGADENAIPIRREGAGYPGRMVSRG